MYVDFKIKVVKTKDRKPTYHLLISDDSQDHKDDTVNHKFYDYLTLDPQTEARWLEDLPDGVIGQFWYDEHWKTNVHEANPYVRDGGWKFHRFKHDKHTADTEQTLAEVWNRILNAVPRDMLEDRVNVIRDNWKRRQSNKPGGLRAPSTPLLQTPTATQTSYFLDTGPSSHSDHGQLVSPSESLQPPPHDSRQPLALRQDNSDSSEPSETLESSRRPQQILSTITSENNELFSEERFTSFNSSIESLERQITPENDHFEDSSSMIQKSGSGSPAESQKKNVSVTSFPSFECSVPLGHQNGHQDRQVDPSTTKQSRSVEFHKSNSFSQEQLVPAISFELRSSQHLSSSQGRNSSYEMRDSTEKKEIFGSHSPNENITTPPSQLDRCRETFQKQPLLDINESQEHLNSHEIRDYEKKEVTVNRQPDENSNFSFKT
ncbi:2949_t:CDS:2, partial [Acaulospora colombiana]